MIVLPKSMLDALDAAGFDSPIVTIPAFYYRRQYGHLIDEVRLSQRRTWLMADTTLEYGCDVELVQTLLRQAALSSKRVLREPAPFVGLTGTVIGVLAAFQAMAAAGAQGGAGVMSSIAGALVATAAGLFVAIPAVVFHNLLQARVDWILDESRQLRGILVARSIQAVASGVEEPA